MRFRAAALLLFLPLPFATAAPPPDLPGEELTDRQVFQQKRNHGDMSAAAIEDAIARASRTERSWLEGAMETWNAPPLYMQQATDGTIIPYGKGGIFVPTYTETSSEPDIEVFDLRDSLVASGQPGRTFALEPGEYKVMLGSGSRQQRIVKNVKVDEGAAQPLIPDWSGLVIDVVDEQGVALKGEYELVRIDEFDPYGRGYGASVELGETVKAWILKPGVYKILGVGEGYNTLTNFVTVRLLSGEFTTFLLIQDPNDFRIRGGGTIHLTPTAKLASNWLFGINVGINAQFNTEIDHQTELTASTFTLGGLLDAWLLYRKKPVEWSTRLRLDESINLTDEYLENMVNNPDRLLMSSIFIWRILDWFGPYARMESNTRVFDSKIKRASESGFCFTDADYVFHENIGLAGLDTTQVYTIEPAFSPFIVELGAGMNFDLTTRRYFEAKTRLGFGCAYSRYDDRYRIIESGKVKYVSEDSLEQKLLVLNSVVLFPEERVNILEVGPQASLDAAVRIGSLGSAEGEVKLFAPVLPEQRLTKPDIEFSGTLSWRLHRSLNLDYTYRQSLKRPAELDEPVHTSTHGIWLRLHYSNR
ncbi:MAG: hypothetical protein LBB74_00710 [Chitinispirillales bacterium]|jgi:hypothetical protein|nr:hypothetical protein [Chitinispirillales bacterium]